VALLTATQIQAKWLANYQGAGTAMSQGAQAVQTAPGQKAAAQAALWLQRIQQSQPKWAANVAKVTLAEWQQAYITLGIPNGQQGASAKQAKYGAFISQYMAFLQNQVPTIKAMPKGTLQAGIARATAMITASYNWGQSRA
jgi:hypothetical protein